jgi:hypothetical protein
VSAAQEFRARKAAEAIRSAFFTSVSGEKPHRYHLSLAYQTMDEMHAAEDAIKAWAVSVLEPATDRMSDFCPGYCAFGAEHTGPCSAPSPIPAAPDLADAAQRLLTVFDQQRMTAAERIIVGVSDASLRTEGNAAIEALRAALAKAHASDILAAAPGEVK